MGCRNALVAAVSSSWWSTLIACSSFQVGPSSFFLFFSWEGNFGDGSLDESVESCGMGVRKRHKGEGGNGEKM